MLLKLTQYSIKWIQYVLSEIYKHKCLNAKYWLVMQNKTRNIGIDTEDNKKKDKMIKV